MDPAGLQATGTATVRSRRLPAEQVVWLVIDMALFRNRSTQDIVNKLDLALPEGSLMVAPSSVVEARVRLGAEPIEWLFGISADHWAHASARGQITVQGLPWCKEPKTVGLASLSSQIGLAVRSPMVYVRSARNRRYASTATGRQSAPDPDSTVGIVDVKLAERITNLSPLTQWSHEQLQCNHAEAIQIADALGRLVGSSMGGFATASRPVHAIYERTNPPGGSGGKLTDRQSWEPRWERRGTALTRCIFCGHLASILKRTLTNHVLHQQQASVINKASRRVSRATQ